MPKAPPVYGEGVVHAITGRGARIIKLVESGDWILVRQSKSNMSIRTLTLYEVAAIASENYTFSGKGRCPEFEYLVKSMSANTAYFTLPAKKKKKEKPKK